jgi:hypothetical protein
MQAADRGWDDGDGECGSTARGEARAIGEVAKVSRSVRDYLANLARENPVSEDIGGTERSFLFKRPWRRAAGSHECRSG